MRAYDAALFLALLGALTGAFQGLFLMTGEDVFAGADYSPLSEDKTIGMSESDLTAGSNADGSIGITEWMIREYQMLGVFMNSLLRIVWIHDLLISVFPYIPAPDDPGSNLFRPFADVIQAGIIMIYGSAGVQLWRRTGFRGMR